MSVVRVQDPPAMGDHAQREPLPQDVARVQDELGIRQSVAAEDYGPTSALSEQLLLRGYGLAGEEDG